MRDSGYTRVTIRQIENAYVVDIVDEKYNIEEFAFQSLDNIIEKIQEVFKQDGKE